MQTISGTLFQYSDEAHLMAFASTGEDGLYPKCLILVGGLTDGFLSLRWASDLSKRVQEIGFTLVLVNLSSSFLQFGISTLRTDADELTKLVLHLRRHCGAKCVVVMGHSTGANDVMQYLKENGSKEETQLNGVILHSPVSDREYLSTLDDFKTLRNEASNLISNGQPNALLSKRVAGAPITAYRYNSLTSRLGDDDMFSTDLTESEIRSIAEPLRHVKEAIALIASENDEYVSDHEAFKQLLIKLANVSNEAWGATATVEFLPGGHGLEAPTQYRQLVYNVTNFLSSLKTD